MCSEPIAFAEYDLLDRAIQAMEASPDDAYWARRLLDLVRDPALAVHYRSAIVTAVSRWARHDPSFFVHERYLSEQLAVWAWPSEVIIELDATLTLEDPSLAHLVLGRLWLEARRPPEDVPEFYARAANHLRQVEPRLRFGCWHEAMCEALGVADPQALAAEAGELLATAPPNARERAVVAILRGAARSANWPLYDEHRRAYQVLEVNGVRFDSEISRLDGQRAEKELFQAPRLPTIGKALGITARPASRPRSR